ncbi:hypothetical protein DESAMIL20_104 [Desulfurella amilsii]|uniref:3'-phosphate/5'-hydroxy nucleic acid ligase n=1 Tax=Desulfurella amilsii TaxID=1562698 RepID=A0A1X4XZN5_9BACT|nr:RtcB family protein [Desulfurella amilsii]OSS42996.1 hypothetical protein DESAMIL20_104 [Desulfurella amilsii]
MHILVAKNSDQTLNSICHGVGRVLGRRQAIKTLKNQDLIAQLKQKDILKQHHLLTKILI